MNFKVLKFGQIYDFIFEILKRAVFAALPALFAGTFSKNRPSTNKKDHLRKISIIRKWPQFLL
jgi:hypothetical protein